MRRRCTASLPWGDQAAGGARWRLRNIAWAPTVGITRLQLQVFENNVPAIRLYERVGFQHEGRRRKAVAVAEQKIDVLVMSLIVDNE